VAEVLDVAEYIRRCLPALTTMKLQKLVYFSQAVHLVETGNPLFAAQIEAWVEGPVVRELFNEVRGKRSTPVLPGDPNRLNPVEVASIMKTLDWYGGYSGEVLSEMTHADAPWRDGRKGLAPTQYGTVTIEPLAMLSFYETLFTTVPDDLMSADEFASAFLV
jgi:uncharacterized phage-associated protein